MTDVDRPLRENLSQGARQVAKLAGFPPWWHTVPHSIAGAVTLLMVFAIEHDTSRESQAILLKLDELIRASAEARNDVIDVQSKPPTHQEELASQVVASEPVQPDQERIGQPSIEPDTPPPRSP